jgi:hypothetical protein
MMLWHANDPLGVIQLIYYLSVSVGVNLFVTKAISFAIQIQNRPSL